MVGAAHGTSGLRSQRAMEPSGHGASGPWNPRAMETPGRPTRTDRTIGLRPAGETLWISRLTISYLST